MTYPKVSIIILNWNGLEDTLQCLQSLKGITYPNARVVVVDNGSEGNDVAVLRDEFGDYIEIIENGTNLGFAEGNNVGMRYAFKAFDPEYVLLLNNDTVVAPDFLSELISTAARDPAAGIVGPKVYFYHDPDKIQSAGGRFKWWTGQGSLTGCRQLDRGQFDEAAEVEWVSGCALLISRRVIADIGLLLPEYFAYFEEADWCARCRKAGYKVLYAPEARIWHKGEGTIARIDGFQIYYMTRNQFLFMKRNATKPQLASFLVHFLLVQLPMTAGLLTLRQRDFASLRSLYRGALDGARLILSGPGNGR